MEPEHASLHPTSLRYDRGSTKIRITLSADVVALARSISFSPRQQSLQHQLVQGPSLLHGCGVRRRSFMWLCHHSTVACKMCFRSDVPTDGPAWYEALESLK